PDERESPPEMWSPAFTLWMRACRFADCVDEVRSHIRRVLDANPFTTLRVVLECQGADVEAQFSRRFLEAVTAECQRTPTYLDRYYALQPGRANGAKRVILVVPAGARPEWVEEVEPVATVVTEPRALASGY